MTRGLAVALAVFLTGTWAWAEEPTDEAKRAEAHRSVYRRLSRTGGARTGELGLSKAATTFVDMHLDMQRNRFEARSGRAPRSRMFMGTAHPVIAVEKGRLSYRAAFARFTIDEVSLPIEELIDVLEVAVNAKRFAPAGLTDEKAVRLADLRLGLIADVAAHGQEHLGKNARWTRATEVATAALIAAVATLDAIRLYPLLAGLRRIGDDDATTKLIEILAELPATDRRKGILRACIAGMPSDAARAFVIETLRSEDEAAIVAVLGGVGKHSGTETIALVGRILEPDSEAHLGLRHNAISALERNAGPAAAKALLRTFEKTPSENEKYHVGCALVRLGSDAPVPWLRKFLVKLQDKDDPQSKARAEAVEQLLKRGS